MLSRRNIRIKVMQVLYSKEIDTELSAHDIKQRYLKSINQYFELFLYNLYIMEQVVVKSSNEHEKRISKRIQESYDKVFTDKIRMNDIIQSLEKNKMLHAEYDKLKFSERTDRDLIKNLYRRVSDTDAYKTYVQNPETDLKSDLDMLLSIYRDIRKDEVFLELIEQRYPNWWDDSSLIIGAVKRALKALPSESDDFYLYFKPDDETTQDYGLKLLDETIRSDADLEEIIEPTLKNWDKDRLAQLDLIVLKMALVEFKKFPSIPTKVTINEYLEVSKMYSTDKSKEFINGILDRLMNDLKNSGDLNKIDSKE